MLLDLVSILFFVALLIDYEGHQTSLNDEVCRAIWLSRMQFKLKLMKETS